MSLYPAGFPGVNLGGTPDPDPVAEGQVCPECRGVSTFFYRDPATGPELVCTDCLTGAFDTVDPSPLPPPLRVRLLGRLAGTGVVIYEYFMDPVEGPARGPSGEPDGPNPRPPATARGRRRKRP